MIFVSNEDEVKFDNKILAIYFYANWMPYHKKMLTMIGKIEEKYKEVIFLAIDVDYFKSFCKRFNVTSIPEIIVLKNGAEIKRINGLILTSAFKSVIADICNSSTINVEKCNDKKERK